MRPGRSGGARPSGRATPTYKTAFGQPMFVEPAEPVDAVHRAQPRALPSQLGTHRDAGRHRPQLGVQVAGHHQPSAGVPGVCNDAGPTDH